MRTLLGWLRKLNVGWTFSYRFWGCAKVNNDLILNRQAYTDMSTVGELFQEGNHMCWTLEPPKDNPKEPKCVPAGRYPVTMAWSTRFKRDTPHLWDIPGRSLIEIHPLNDEHLVTLPDGSHHWTSEGCIGPGLTKDTNWVGSSVAAFGRLVALIEAALKSGPLYIQVNDLVV